MSDDERKDEGQDRPGHYESKDGKTHITKREDGTTHFERETKPGNWRGYDSEE